MPDAANQAPAPAPESRPPLPAVLYKYVPPDRIDILLNRQIRLTQPTSTNDPFELHPAVPDLTAKDLASEDFREMLAKYYPDLLEELRDALRELRDGGPVLRAFLPSYSKQARRTMRLLMAQIGVLSLSKTPASAPMWAHYADAHRGFAIGFDLSVEPFKTWATAGVLAEVKYTADRPVFHPHGTDEKSPFCTMYAKSKEWAYEEEWRYVNLVSNTTRRLPCGGDIAFLVPIQAAAVHSVTLGLQSTPQLRAALPSVPT
jgi:hypothetical protein